MGVKFTGASKQYAEIDSTPISGAVFSASIWFNSVGLAGGDGLFSITDKDVADHYYFLRAGKSSEPTDSKLHLFRRAGGGEDDVDTSTEYGAAAWHNGIIINNGSADAKIYLDNGGEGTDTTDVAPANLDRTAIGGLRDSTPGDYYDGTLAEFGLWNIALTAGERGALAAGYSPLFIRPASLVGYWSLSDINYVDRIGARTFVGANDGGSGAPTNAQDHPGIIYPTGQQIFLPAAVAPPAGVTPRLALLGVG